MNGRIKHILHRILRGTCVPALATCLLFTGNTKADETISQAYSQVDLTVSNSPVAVKTILHKCCKRKNCPLQRFAAIQRQRFFSEQLFVSSLPQIFTSSFRAKRRLIKTGLSPPSHPLFS